MIEHKIGFRMNPNRASKSLLSGKKWHFNVKTHFKIYVANISRQFTWRQVISYHLIWRLIMWIEVISRQFTWRQVISYYLFWRRHFSRDEINSNHDGWIHFSSLFLALAYFIALNFASGHFISRFHLDLTSRHLWLTRWLRETSTLDSKVPKHCYVFRQP